MINTSTLHPDPVVGTVEDKGRSAFVENVNPLPKDSEDLSKGIYNPSCYVMPINQAKLEMVLPTGMEIWVVWEDGPSQGLDDLADLEEDMDNIQFFDKQDRWDVHIDWFDLNGLTNNSG